MVWVRLEDDYRDHPKMEGVDAHAELLWIRGLAYANRFRTDGFVPPSVVTRLGQDLSGIVLELSRNWSEPVRRIYGRPLANRLVRAGLWLPVEGGWMIHDYCDYQPTKAELAERAAKTRARVAAHRARQRAAAEQEAAADVTPLQIVRNAVTANGCNAPPTRPDPK